MRIAINGFGRIGRNFLRAVRADKSARDKLKVVAINIGAARPELVAGMFMRDTLMGKYPGTASVEGNIFILDGERIALIQECDPCDISWGTHNVDWVVESSGCFTHCDDAMEHVKAGAKKVLITAPAKEEDVSIILGVNEDAFDADKHKIVSMGSCTTNAIVPLLKVIHEAFTITSGFMTSIHAYTNAQVLLDVEDTDLRRSRSAPLNIIPTTTGAATMIGQLLPDLKGKVGATAVRVPVAKGSLLDLVVQVERSGISTDAVNDACRQAAGGALAGIMSVTDEPLVSSDICGDPHSVIVDSLLTSVHGQLVHLLQIVITKQAC